MKDWRVDTLYAMLPRDVTALEKAATAECECQFCGQPAGLWCRVSQKEFTYTPSPHMARKFSWLDLAGSKDAALMLLDLLWIPEHSRPAWGEGPGTVALPDAQALMDLEGIL